MSFSSPKSPILSPMSPIVEDIPSDSNSVLTSEEPFSPTLQPQRKYSALKAKPTTQLSLNVSSPTAYSSSSAGSSVKSFNVESSINGENRSKEGSVDDFLIGLMNRSNSVFGNGTGFNKKRNFTNELESDMILDYEMGNDKESIGTHFIFFLKKKYIYIYFIEFLITRFRWLYRMGRKSYKLRSFK